MATIRPVVLLAFLLVVVSPVFGSTHHSSKLAPKTVCNVTGNNPIIVTGNLDSGDRAIAVLLSKAGVFIATGDADCTRFKGDLPAEACSPTLTMENSECSAPTWDYRLSWDFEEKDLLESGDACGHASPEIAKKHKLAVQSVHDDVTGASVRYQRCGCPTASLGGRYGIKNVRGLLALPLLKLLFPKMTLIHVVRDGRDLALGNRARTLRDKLAAVLVGSGDLHTFHEGEMLRPITKIKSLKTLFCHASGPTAPVLPSRCDDCLLDCANVHVPIALERRRTEHHRQLVAAHNHTSSASHGSHSSGSHSSGSHGKSSGSHGHSSGHKGLRRRTLLHSPHHKDEEDFELEKEAGPPRPNFAGSPEFMECMASCSKFGRTAALPLAAAEVLANITNPEDVSAGVIAPIPTHKQMNFSYNSHLSLDVVIPEGAEGLARAASAKVWSVLNLQVEACAARLRLGDDYIRVRIEDFLNKNTREDAITSLLTKLGVPKPGSSGQASMKELSAVFDHALPDLHLGEEVPKHGKSSAKAAPNATLPVQTSHFGRWKGSSYLSGIEMAAWPALERFGYALSMPVMKEAAAAPAESTPEEVVGGPASLVTDLAAGGGSGGPLANDLAVIGGGEEEKKVAPAPASDENVVANDAAGRRRRHRKHY
eukprot:jgi/Mesvir1/821/Mv17405-RA.1